MPCSRSCSDAPLDAAPDLGRPVAAARYEVAGVGAPRSAVDAVEGDGALARDGLLLLEGQTFECLRELLGDPGELGVGVGVVGCPDDVVGTDQWRLRGERE